MFLNINVSQGGVVSPSPNPQTGRPPLVGCPRLLIQYIRSYPPCWRPFLYPQPEDAPCRGDRDPLQKLIFFLFDYNSNALSDTILLHFFSTPILTRLFSNSHSLSFHYRHVNHTFIIKHISASFISHSAAFYIIV